MTMMENDDDDDVQKEGTAIMEVMMMENDNGRVAHSVLVDEAFELGSSSCGMREGETMW